MFLHDYISKFRIFKSFRETHRVSICQYILSKCFKHGQNPGTPVVVFNYLGVPVQQIFGSETDLLKRKLCSVCEIKDDEADKSD